MDIEEAKAILAGVGWSTRDLNSFSDDELIGYAQAELKPELKDQKWYIRHDNCGEVFDSLDAAADHDMDQFANRVNEYTLIPESEAF